MHLLASQPGGFVDEEGIIDLQQSPGRLIILSAADNNLAALVNSAAQMGAEFPSVRLANWMHLLKPAAFDLYRHKVLDHAEVIVVSLLGGQSYWPYGVEQLQEWAEVPGRTLIIVPGDDSEDVGLMSSGTVSLTQANQVWRYLREGGLDNSTQLLHYLHAEFFGASNQWLAPQALPPALIYMPAQGLATLHEWQQCWLNDGAKDADLNAPPRPVVLLLFYRSHLQSANTAMFDDFIDTLRAGGLNPLPVAVRSLKCAHCLSVVNQLLVSSGAALVINTTGFAHNALPASELYVASGSASIDSGANSSDSNASVSKVCAQPSDFKGVFESSVPVLQVLLSSSNEDDWQQLKQGLRGRDIAMQVVLPEMDGHIITRNVSFKTASDYSEQCQTDVIRYVLHRERAEFVSALAKRWCALATKPNGQKRIALILANYPTHDGRIGNGVGLDTPASTVTLLNALKAAGYPLTAIPQHGNELIAQLLGSVTNNPDTVAQQPCQQSLCLEEYQEYFDAMPASARQAVLERWGPAEQDPKVRNGRLMLAGIRLGQTFVGIQPARGYHLDVAANYHDPDLVPPHSYLGFYFWLRHCYQVDAIIHVGKHGNLEWLPGKSLALSGSCWPDLALGPMPHLYPFIVNDPGEGSQAKRRTQAVIIDHLMPPMTRAESYGELAVLENLVDEYYQALGMDVRRQVWLRDKILREVQDSNVREELAVDGDASEDDVLAELDTFLCDIKEAQIRDGLHRLGVCPEGDQLTDTLVALLRLPRGQSPAHHGILHNLALDLGLVDDQGQAFDPLQSSAKPWLGPRPELLQRISDSAWRTDADTRERLELVASAWIRGFITDAPEASAVSDAAQHVFAALASRYIASTATGKDFEARYPRSAAQLIYAKHTVAKALQDSAELEINSLVGGLAGRFVPPGPSGAPTRGRLDVLPTGRNFFSVDNRAIPSKAAWALGELSAQALVERHLQSHGDYPKQLGLSVWGTATMRTGGDDIAQAFALMGVKPVWAEGGQRVVDVEIVPAILMGRPRVDVTLRISGFFRDAFPNVIQLYDTAVRALAALEEPGEANVLRRHVEQRKSQLMAQGVSAIQAQRQASYRVFGSKPGAYGAGLQGLIDQRCWETGADLAEAYLNWGGYAYGLGAGEDVNDSNQTSGSDGSEYGGEAVDARQDFKHRLSQLEVVLQNQDNREHDILDSDDYYQFQGGMSNAVEQFGGQQPAIYHADHANPSAPKIRTLQEELNRVIRSRVLNPKWIKSMRRHGYKGAFEMTASVDYLFAYDATTHLIADYQYEKITDALVLDADNQQFLRDNNPHALEEMAERLLEATQRGLWQQPGDYAAALQGLLIELSEAQEAGLLCSPKPSSPKPSADSDAAKEGQ